jgi:hypothetical protein
METRYYAIYLKLLKFIVKKGGGQLANHRCFTGHENWQGNAYTLASHNSWSCHMIPSCKVA